MTISNAADSLRIFNGDDVTTSFPVTFSFSNDSDLVVITRTDTADFPQQLGVDYSITGDTLAGQGQVTMTLTPTFGTKVIIERQTGARQTVSLTQAAAFPSQAVEASMDDLARVVGDGLSTIKRAVVEDVEEAGQIRLPAKSQRLNRLFGFDDAGDVEFPNRDDFKGDPARIDASGPLSERSLFDAEPEGFTFLATDQDPALFFIREGATSGSWSPGLPFGIVPGDPLRRDFANALTKVPSNLIDVSITARLIRPGDVKFSLYPDLETGSLRADGATIGKVGSGADHEDDAFREAYDRLKTIPNIGNTGLEDFDAGNLVTLPNMTGLGALGRELAGVASNRIQRSSTLTTTNGLTSANTGDASGLAIGMFVFSANVPAGTTITDINGTALTLSAAATGTASGVPARFSLLSDPEALGIVGGTAAHQLLVKELAAHLHGVSDPGHDHPINDPQHEHPRGDASDQGQTVSAGGGVNTVWRSSGRTTGFASTGITVQSNTTGITVQNAGGDLAHPNLQPSMLGDWVVFMKPSPGPIPETLGIDGRFYQFDDATTKADPGDGFLRLDAVFGSATTLWIDGRDANGHDIASYIATWDVGRIEIINVSQPGGILLADITSAATDETGFFEIGFSVVASGGTFAKDDAIAVLFVRRGPQGPAGADGLDGDPGLSWQGAWLTSTVYALNDGVENNGSAYIATSAHTSDATTEPGVGASWPTVWDLFANGPVIAPNSVTNAGLADMATARIKARITAATGDPEDATITQVLDATLGNTRGAMAFRGNTAWSLIVPGAVGSVVTSNGPGADPTYQPGAPSTISDTDLRNFALKLSEQEARRINLVDGIAEPFAAETDVDTATSTGQLYDATNDLYEIAPAADYANTGGTGDRQSIITEAMNVTVDQGTVSNLIDGDFTNDANGSIDITTPQNTSGQFFSFDFGVGNEKYVTQVRVHKNGTADNGNWDIQGSDNGSSWTTYGNFNINGAGPHTGDTSGVPKAGHRHWRIVGVSGAFGNEFYQEIEFQIAAGGSTGTIDLRSNAFTAAAQPTTARLHFHVEEIDAVTINTDVIAHASRDGGTTWTAATLTKVTTLEDGLAVYEDSSIDISAQPAGTSMKWRFTTANDKELKLHAAELQWA